MHTKFKNLWGNNQYYGNKREYSIYSHRRWMLANGILSWQHLLSFFDHYITMILLLQLTSDYDKKTNYYIILLAYILILTTLWSASSVGCQHDTARICCWAPAPAAVNQYLLSTRRSAANPPHAAAAVDRWDRQTDRRTLDRFTDPAPRTTRALLIIIKTHVRFLQVYIFKG